MHKKMCRNEGKMKESRLFQILYYLLERGQATGPELAEKLEVSVRTIYRDIDALSEAGIPVYAERGRDGGVRLMEDFVLDKALFSNAEKQTILDAIQNLAVIEQAEGNALRKLSALFGIQPENWVEIDFSKWGSAPWEEQKFTLLKTAILSHRVVEILYAGANGSMKRRKIQPLKLLCKSGNWYVKAYCMERQDFRVFKISRIVETTMLAEVFVPMSFPKEKDGGETKLCDIKLRFSREGAYRVYDEFDISQITPQGDGTFLVRIRMPEDVWLVNYLLSFGCDVTVIEPEYLRGVLAEEARKIYEKNKSPKTEKEADGEKI